MADLSFGSTFQPDSQNQPWQRPGYGGGGGGASGGAGFSPVQQAVKVLSLRLPQVFGAQAPLAHQLMGGPVGPTQASGVGQSIVGSNQGQSGYGAATTPSLPPVAPPAASNIAGVIKKKIPGATVPDSAAQLAQIIAQLPRNAPPPNISMIRPGPVTPSYPTQVPQTPAYSPAPTPPPVVQTPSNTVAYGAAGPNGNVYSGPPAAYNASTGQYAPGYGPQQPYYSGPAFRSPY